MTRNKKHKVLNKPDDIVNEKKLDINKKEKIIFFCLHVSGICFVRDK